MKGLAEGLKLSASCANVPQVVDPIFAGLSACRQSNVVPYGLVPIPKCWAYQAVSSCGLAHLKNTPPSPVTFFIIKRKCSPALTGLSLSSLHEALLVVTLPVSVAGTDLCPAQAADQGELPFRLYAMMLDRHLMGLGKPQVYGTQGRSYPGQAYFIWPIEDPAHVNERRKKAGFELSVEDNAQRLHIPYQLVPMPLSASSLALGRAPEQPTTHKYALLVVDVQPSFSVPADIITGITALSQHFYTVATVERHDEAITPFERQLGWKPGANEDSLIPAARVFVKHGYLPPVAVIDH
nr:hypothetical protein [Tanacetum cinerariifolium]